MAAAEQGGEERAEMAVHLLEGVEQALAAIHVEGVDAFAQFGDGGDEIVALLDLEAHALRDFGELFVSFHVDGAELVALAAELGEARVERVGVGGGCFFRRIRVDLRRRVPRARRGRRRGPAATRPSSSSSSWSKAARTCSAISASRRMAASRRDSAADEGFAGRA